MADRDVAAALRTVGLALVDWASAMQEHATPRHASKARLRLEDSSYE